MSIKERVLKKFSEQVSKELGFYVYLYVDPRNEEIFYIGKGRGNRCFNHLKDVSDSDKKNRIDRIFKDTNGLGPRIEILAHGLTSDEALKVEAAAIDLVDIKNLTNLKRGHYTKSYGRTSVENIIAEYQAEEAVFEEKGICFKLNKYFDHRLSPVELYDYTRGFWCINVNGKAADARLAFAVYKGVIQEVYEIVSWHEEGQTFSSRKKVERDKPKKEFVGRLASDEKREKYRFKHVTFQSSQASFEFVGPYE